MLPCRWHRVKVRVRLEVYLDKVVVSSDKVVVVS